MTLGSRGSTVVGRFGARLTQIVMNSGEKIGCWALRHTSDRDCDESGGPTPHGEYFWPTDISDSHST
jgi:hypothetical protein